MEDAGESPENTTNLDTEFVEDAKNGRYKFMNSINWWATHPRCVAMISGTSEQCPNDAIYLIVTSQKDKEGKFKPFNQDVFCEDDAYGFSTYYSNYLGLRVIIRRLKIKAEKVSFT